MFNIDFFILGAQKAGTSTLHEVLRSSSQVVLPKNKETHYFSFDEKYKLGYRWYKSQFYNNGKIYGEVDPSYLYIKKSAKRIKEINNKPKFIIILRKPIERSFSHYLMSKNRGYENLSFNEAIDAESNRLQSTNIFDIINFSYLDRSNYSNQISVYKKVFPKSDFLYLKFDDFFVADKTTRMYKEIFSFLSLDYEGEIKDIHINRSYSSKIKFINNLLYNSLFIKTIGKIFIPNNNYRFKIKKYISELNRSSKKLPKLNIDKLSKDIIQWNNNEVHKLNKITKLQLENWII
tara:strand:+ start:1002 stop:1874 length:873 start_codon:yes stop_codon:yes gene_type:complete